MPEAAPKVANGMSKNQKLIAQQLWVDIEFWTAMALPSGFERPFPSSTTMMSSRSALENRKGSWKMLEWVIAGERLKIQKQR